MRLSEILMTISDQGNAFASKAITWLGLSSIGGGAATFVSQKSVEQPETVDWPTYAAIASIIGVASLVLKNVSDWYYNRKRDKREEEAARRAAGGDL